ncbi:MAG: hypothetical protein JO247_05655 [Chloroflexi bacterium]|nr:hypothetical protein [Chloroflexota bacterium]
MATAAAQAPAEVVSFVVFTTQEATTRGFRALAGCVAVGVWLGLAGAGLVIVAVTEDVPLARVLVPV